MDFMGFMEAMGTSGVPAIAAFFIGLLMAISPCPLATNITAIAYAPWNSDTACWTARRRSPPPAPCQCE